MITFFEGKSPSFSSCADPRQLVGQRFHDVCADEALRESVRKILDEEVEVVSVQTETLAADGKLKYNRYRVRGPFSYSRPSFCRARTH